MSAPAHVDVLRPEPQSYLIPKRLFDVLAATMALIVALPVLVVVAVLIRLSSPGPIFYASRRVGQHGSEFDMWKLRSMNPDSEDVGAGDVTVRGDPRVTPVGRWLRSLKIDELPQLWNVIKGDMSIVGPRPELPAWVRLYDERQRQVLAVRPGITDPVQVLFRHECDYLDSAGAYEGLMRIKVDRQLQCLREGRSLRKDVGALARTLAALFQRAPSAEAMGIYRRL